MAEKPVCSECEFYRFIKARGSVPGYECYCTAQSLRGRLIDYQYGRSQAWTRQELVDRMEIRICPKWCPKKIRRDEK